jgi:hypothetical protein
MSAIFHAIFPPFIVNTPKQRDGGKGATQLHTYFAVASDIIFLLQQTVLHHHVS